MPHNLEKHDLQTCHRCDETFPCLANRVGECPCHAVPLTREETEWIAFQTREECICVRCLIALRDQFPVPEKVADTLL